MQSVFFHKYLQGPIICMVCMLRTDLKASPLQRRPRALERARLFWNPQAKADSFKAVHGLPCLLTAQTWAALKCPSVETWCVLGRWWQEQGRSLSARPLKLVVSLSMASLLIVALLWWHPCSLSRIWKINTTNTIQNSTQLNSLIAIYTTQLLQCN